MNAWSRWEVGAASGFMLVALANLFRFGPGVEMLAGIAGAAVVLLLRQWGVTTPQASWFVAPIAVIGLQAKMVGGCPSCGPSSACGTALTSFAGTAQLGAALLGVMAIFAPYLFRLKPNAWVAIALSVFMGRGARGNGVAFRVHRLPLDHLRGCGIGSGRCATGVCRDSPVSRSGNGRRYPGRTYCRHCRGGGVPTASGEPWKRPQLNPHRLTRPTGRRGWGHRGAEFAGF